PAETDKLLKRNNRSRPAGFTVRRSATANVFWHTGAVSNRTQVTDLWGAPTQGLWSVDPQAGTSWSLRIYCARRWHNCGLRSMDNDQWQGATRTNGRSGASNRG